MPSYTTPARIRWARSANTGQIPTTLAPGSMAVNWPDKKVFVGDAGAQPVLFSQWLEDWTALKLYRQDDFCIYQSDIWRALVDIAPGGPFRTEQWIRLTSASAASIAEPYASDIYEGGIVSLVDPATIRVTQGSGVVVDNTDPSFPQLVLLAWSDFDAPVTYQSTTWTVIALNAAGAIQVIPENVWNEEMRRDHVVLAYGAWNTAGELTAVFDGSRRAGGTAETVIDQYEIEGGAYRASGLVPFPRNGTLTINITDGEVFAMGGAWRTAPKRPNRISISGLPSPVAFYRVSLSGLESGPLPEPDPTQRDIPGIGLSPVAPGEATIQYLYANQDFSLLFLQYGQNVYNSVTEAGQNITEDYALFQQAGILPNLVLVGAFLLDGGAADFDTATLARVVNAGRDPAPFTSSGVLDDSAYYYLDGSRSLTGDMDADGFAVTNADLDGGVYA